MEDVKPLVPVKTDENDNKVVIFFGSIPVPIELTIVTKDAMPSTFGTDEDDGTLVTQTPTGERADDPMYDVPLSLISNGHAFPFNEDTKGETSGGEENGNPLLVKPNDNKGKGIATSSDSKGKGNTKTAAGPVVNTPRNELSAVVSAAVASAANVTINIDTPLWFTLLALTDQETDAPLPQISNRYFRVRNGNLPVSCLQNYIAMKLSLESEDEVELYLIKDLVLQSSMLLYQLLGYYIATVSPRMGSSGANYMVVLSYGGKPPLKNPVTQSPGNT
ncbi:unnamed protein product [Thlaspi arvense]|uniref:Uncharacterized protein n=1 Tax=Thlaspi arvense TaxID=13288 RepID=A0AAU9T7Y3_THLAR|nr:unnamed protein product [Thlaspi arvense]